MVAACEPHSGVHTAGNEAGGYWNAIIQIFADGISEAVGHGDKAKRIQLARKLMSILLRNNETRSLPKRRNFVAGGNRLPTQGKE